MFLLMAYFSFFYHVLYNELPCCAFIIFVIGRCYQMERFSQPLRNSCDHQLAGTMSNIKSLRILSKLYFYGIIVLVFKMKRNSWTLLESSSGCFFFIFDVIKITFLSYCFLSSDICAKECDFHSNDDRIASWQLF